MYIEENPVQGVETILDIGTGTGGSAFVLGQLFPEVHITTQIICDKKMQNMLRCFFVTNFVNNWNSFFVKKCGEQFFYVIFMS